MCGGGHKPLQVVQGVLGYIGVILAWAAAGAPWVLTSLGSSFGLVSACVNFGLGVACSAYNSDGVIGDALTALNRLRAACGLLAFAGILLLVVSILSSTRCCLCCGAGRGANTGNVIAAVVISVISLACLIAGAAIPPATSASFLGYSTTVAQAVGNVPGVTWGPGYGLAITACIFQAVVLVMAVLELVVKDNTPKPAQAFSGNATIVVTSPAAGQQMMLGGQPMMIAPGGQVIQGQPMPFNGGQMMPGQVMQPVVIQQQ